MLREFVGTLAAGGQRIGAALGGEGHVVELGPLSCAYTGPALPEPEAGAPVCLLDGTVYEAVGMSLPAREGPALEAFLAEAYRLHGEDLLTRLRGEFAFLVYDPGVGEGLLVRDQIGGRGAVWHASGSRVLFATDYRPLLGALPRRPDPDPAAMAHWLAVSGMPGDRSLFSGVRRVEAGCALRLRGGRGVPFRYWSPSHQPPLDGEPDEHARALRGALERAVRRRIGPDESVGVLLSGGLDSGSVAAIAAEERSALPTYSATFPRHPTADESELIDELGTSLGLRSTTIQVRGGSILRGALAYLKRFELPPASPNLFFWVPLQRAAARDGVAALLDGEGGDELFGPSFHLLSDRLSRGRVLGARELVGRIPGTGTTSMRTVSSYLRWGLKGAAPYRLHDMTRRLRGPQRYAPGWMRRETAADFIESDDSHAWKRLRAPRWFAHQAWWVTRGMGPALTYDHVRRRAALAGLEPRHPLVDVDVVELVLRMPPELAFDPERSRPMLRRAMKGLLPDAVRLRATKSNFDAVFHEALAGDDLPAVRALLGRPGAEVGAYVVPSRVAELIAAPPEKPGAMMWWALHVWRLVTAECWLITQHDPEALDRLLPAPAEPQVERSPAAPVRVRG